MSLVCCFHVERGKACPDTAGLRLARGSVSSGRNRKGLSTVAGRAGGLARSSDETPVIGAERRGQVIRGLFVRSTGRVPGGVAWTN